MSGFPLHFTVETTEKNPNFVKIDSKYQALYMKTKGCSALLTPTYVAQRNDKYNVLLSFHGTAVNIYCTLLSDRCTSSLQTKRTTDCHSSDRYARATMLRVHRLLSPKHAGKCHLDNKCLILGSNIINKCCCKRIPL
jgi:hypothetical protein